MQKENKKKRPLKEISTIFWISLIFVIVNIVLFSAIKPNLGTRFSQMSILDTENKEKSLGNNPAHYYSERIGSKIEVINPTLKLKDIPGMHKEKKEALQLLPLIQDPNLFKKIGVQPSKGIILDGLTGMGKNLLARAIAGEANFTFIAVPHEIFLNRYLEKGLDVKSIFSIAEQYAPSILFIEDIDKLAPSSKRRELTQNQNQTTRELLYALDNLNISKNKRIFIIGSTNNVESINPTLFRAGRLDLHIHMALPTSEERKEVLQMLMQKMSIDPSVSIEEIVEKSAGFSGSSLYNLLNKAGLVAVKNKKTSIDRESINEAFKLIASRNELLNPFFSIKIIAPGETKVKLKDIVGMDAIKKEVSEVLEFLENPKQFSRLGAKAPNGILFYGPPGTGKTSTARAIAQEAKVPFISVSGALFNERSLGIGASRVRELFNTARKYSPCLLFIDEIDALIPKRGSDQAPSELDRTLSQFIDEIDNMQTYNKGIILMAATNKLDLLDPDLLRAGRFDKQIYFPLPNLLERESILKAKLKHIKYKPNLDISLLAKITVGYSGADLENLVNEAAIDATRKNKLAVDMTSFEEANDKISLGINLGSNTYTQAEKKRTAIHEAGHAIVGLFIPEHPQVFHKMTIGLRGESMGVTHFRLEADKHAHTKKELEALIATALGGYVAEEIIYGKENISVGASGDLINANEIARNMVTEWGMSDENFLMVESIFPEQGDFVKLAEEILHKNYLRSKKILEQHKDKLNILANALLESESLDHDQIMHILKLNPSSQKVSEGSAKQ